MFNSAATELILKIPFFLRCSVWAGRGFIFQCPLCCPAQLGGSLVTICLPRLRPAGVRFALLLQALPCCCSLCAAAMGYTLRRSLSVVAGCLGNGRLCHQWACTSVRADCLGNGGRPSPTELHCLGFSCTCCKTQPRAFPIAVLFVFVGVRPAEPDHLAPCLRALVFFFCC